MFIIIVLARSSKSNNLHVQRCHKKSFAYKGVNSLSKMPDNIKTVSSLTFWLLALRDVWAITAAQI